MVASSAHSRAGGSTVSSQSGQAVALPGVP
jgi:hypothetical protein